MFENVARRMYEFLVTEAANNWGDWDDWVKRAFCGRVDVNLDGLKEELITISRLDGAGSIDFHESDCCSSPFGHLLVEMRNISSYPEYLDPPRYFGDFIVITPISPFIEDIWSLKVRIFPGDDNMYYWPEYANLRDRFIDQFKPHPHVGTSGEPCFGSLEDIVRETIVGMSYSNTMALIREFLSSPNIEDDWGKSALSWPIKKDGIRCMPTICESCGYEESVCECRCATCGELDCICCSYCFTYPCECCSICGDFLCEHKRQEE